MPRSTVARLLRRGASRGSAADCGARSALCSDRPADLSRASPMIGLQTHLASRTSRLPLPASAPALHPALSPTGAPHRNTPQRIRTDERGQEEHRSKPLRGWNRNRDSAGGETSNKRTDGTQAEGRRCSRVCFALCAVCSVGAAASHFRCCLVLQLSNAENSVATLVVLGEDHTLGNSFRYVLAKNKQVDFVGYSIPHPSEMKLNMRIQTKGAQHNDTTNARRRVTACGVGQCNARSGLRGAFSAHALPLLFRACLCVPSLLDTDVQSVLVESAQTLSDICDHVLATFDAAEQRYLQQHPAKPASAAAAARMED